MITAVLGAGLEQWMANQDPVLDGSDPEGVHQMRVALRRLRSALSLFKDVLPGRTTGWIRDETRWLAGSLGPAREWDVFMAQTLAPVEQAAPGDPGLAAVRAAAEAERQAGYETARAVIGSPRYTTLVLSVGRWLDTSGWREAADAETLARLDAPALDFTRGLLGKRHRKLLKAGKRFDTLTPEERHQARIQAKKLRYPADFFRSFYPKKPTKAFLEALARLQDGLGHLNDVATARTLVGTLLVRPADTVEAAVDRSLGAGLVLGWHTRGAADMEPAIRKDWRAFARTEPFWRP